MATSFGPAGNLFMNKISIMTEFSATLPREKQCVFVVSTGRTGTQFFVKNAPSIIEDCVSFHEPDTIWLSRPYEWYSKARLVGLRQLTMDKVLPARSLRSLSNARARREITDDAAMESLRSLRKRLIEEAQGSVVLEANAAYFGLIDLIPKLFPSAKIVFIIRDPRDWVRSMMNKSFAVVGPYATFDVRCWIPKARLAASQFREDAACPLWRRMSRFEKLCWLWNCENSFALECASKTDHVRICRFEDIFGGSSRKEAFCDLLEFLTSFPNGERAQWHLDEKLLSRKVHSTASGSFPSWPEWEQKLVEQMHTHCHGLMEKFGYGQELEWNHRIEKE